jgi:hypothetical protein
LLLLLNADAVFGDVTLPKILASHMVVQRDLPVHVWGWATAGESIDEVENSQSKRLGWTLERRGLASAHGRW